MSPLRLLLYILFCIVQLRYTDKDVIYYFIYRQLDSERNALNSYVYWSLRDTGNSGSIAQKAMSRMSNKNKYDFLEDQGILYENIPSWQRCGTLLPWETVAHEGYNPITEENVMTTRRRITLNEDVGSGDDFAHQVLSAINEFNSTP